MGEITDGEEEKNGNIISDGGGSQASGKEETIRGGMSEGGRNH